MVKKNKEFISKPIAPEDVRAGEYVALLHMIAERVPGCWCDVDATQQITARRFMRWPTHESHPFRVVEVCLPFVFVKKPDGVFMTLDTRRCRLALLERAYGRRVFNALALQARKHAKKAKASEDEQDSDAVNQGEG